MLLVIDGHFVMSRFILYTLQDKTPFSKGYVATYDLFVARNDVATFSNCSVALYMYVEVPDVLYGT